VEWLYHPRIKEVTKEILAAIKLCHLHSAW
jgi:hypothetical protein